MSSLHLLQFDLMSLPEGTAIVVVGVLALLLWAAVQFRNPLAVVMWAIGVIILVFSSLYNLGDELFWIALLVTAMIVLVGVIARASK